MLVWGGVCAATAAVQNFAQLLVVRIFLGVTEAPFFPGAIFLMSSWYMRQELTKLGSMGVWLLRICLVVWVRNALMAISKMAG
jgi:MFS family permease